MRVCERFNLHKKDEKEKEKGSVILTIEDLGGLECEIVAIKKM